MKLVVRWSLALGLVGSTLLGTLFGVNVSAIALPPEKIKEKLDAIPVYLVTNDKGLPLSRTLPGNKDGRSITGVYMSKQEAEDAVKKLQGIDPKSESPEQQAMLKTLQVSAVPLGLIYQQLQQTKNDPKSLLFAFKPVDGEIQKALELLNQKGEKIDKFNGVPIFAVRFEPKGAYVPILIGDRDKTPYIRLFFSEGDALDLLARVKPQFPNADIQVIDINSVIKTLQEKNEDWLKQVVLFPSPESREYIQTLYKQNSSQVTSPSGTSPSGNSK